MHVLTVGNMYPPHHRGGYERMWAAAVAALRARGHDVTVLTTTHREPRVDASDPPWVHRTLDWFWADEAFTTPGWREARRITRHAADEVLARPHDVVQWWSMGGLPLGMLHATRRPSLAIVHDGWPTYAAKVDRWSALWRRGLPVKRVRWWSLSSQYTRDLLLRARVDLPADRTSIDHPGIDLAAFPAAPPRDDWTGRLGLVGRIEPRKGVDVALAAVEELPGATLVVAGAGEPPRGPRVEALGPVADPAAVYAGVDCVLFPVTWEEPFGLVPLEAMAVGRPVVATGTGGSAEFLADGSNCLLVPPGDPGALAAAVRRLAEDRDLRERLVAAGRETAAHFTLARFTDAIVQRTEALGH